MKAIQDKSVAGKVIVCTGAAGVLCSSMTEDLLKHGAKVAVLDLRGDVARDFCKKLAKKGLKQTMAVEANVLDKASLETACKAILKKWKKIDILINGAGGNHPKGTTPAEQMTKKNGVTFDLTPYMKSESLGEAEMTISLGDSVFFKVKAGTVEK